MEPKQCIIGSQVMFSYIGPDRDESSLHTLHLPAVKMDKSLGELRKLQCSQLSSKEKDKLN